MVKIGQLGANQDSDLVAGFTGQDPQVEQFTDLTQGEPEILGRTNEAQLVQRIIIVISIARIRPPMRLGQQAFPLVVADSLHVYPGLAGKFSYGHERLLDLIPYYMVYAAAMKKNGSPWLLTGGVLAGLAASLCCIGPLLSLGLGLGSFAAAAWFAQWRPVLLGVTFAFLGLAWFLTYRRPKTDCADGSCARSPGKAARVSLWLGTIVALAAAIYPSLPAANHKINAAVVAGSDAKLSVLIPSMDCPPCAAGIEASLRRAPGVKQAAVDYGSKEAVLVYDPSVTNRDKLLALIDASGFPADRSSLK